MKKTLIALGILMTLVLGTQTSFAACPCSMGHSVGYASPCSSNLTGNYSYPNVIGSAPCPCTNPCPSCSSNIILPRPNCGCGCQSVAPCVTGCAAPCSIAPSCGCGCATGFAAPGPCQNNNFSYRRGCNCDKCNDCCD